MTQGFTAGKCDTATRRLEEGSVALDLGHQFGHGAGLADELPRPARTDLGTGAATAARAVVPVRPASRSVAVRLRARFDAGAAGYAFLFDDGHLRSAIQALRVVAPVATQWTSLEKDRGPDPGSVVDRATLNVDDGHPLNRGRGGGG